MSESAACHRAKRKAFTLIELLVVIAIIALLVSILMPALHKARTQAKKLQCANHERIFGLAMHMYAEQDSAFKIPTIGPSPWRSWLWNLRYSFTDLIMDLGQAEKEIFYCPLSPTHSADLGRSWNFLEIPRTPANADDPAFHPEEESTDRTGNIRITGYAFLLEVDKVQQNDTRNEAIEKGVAESENRLIGVGNEFRFVDSTEMSSAAARPWVTDAVLSSNLDPLLDLDGPFTARGSSWNWWNVPDRSSGHFIGDDFPSDTNVLYLDGHVDRSSAGEIEVRVQYGPYWWW